MTRGGADRNSHPSWLRAGAALIVGGVGGAALPVLALITSISLNSRGHFVLDEDTRLAGLAALVAISVTTFGLALPAYAYLRGNLWISFASVLSSGALVGLPAATLWLAFQSMMHDALSRWLATAFPLALLGPGAIGASLFWAIAYPRESASSAD